MPRILTGIQSSGRPHLGNILGAILPAIELSKDAKNECFYFIADLHSLTSLKNAEDRKEHTYATAAAWLALGLDTGSSIFYRQSMVSEVCELAWYLNCFTPYPMLANSHSFKDKSDKLSDVNAGLFTYPVLMAADIILYDANLVPVGKDQKQHLEITRDIATNFNREYGEVFIVPDALIDDKVMTIPGVDGKKMSKSYGNIIDIFLPEKKLRKQIMKIVTDSTPVEEPKNPDSCIVFQLYSVLANKDRIVSMREKYENGNYGYGQAKQELFELVLEKFETAREKFNFWMENKSDIDSQLIKGEKKAKEIASSKLSLVRKKLGY